MNHEYLADEAALKQNIDLKTYQFTLLDYIENTKNPLVSTFNYKLTKKRFIMMKIQTKRQTRLLVKAFALLTTIVMLSIVGCSKQDDISEITKANAEEEKPLSKVQQKAVPKEGIQKFMQNFIREFKFAHEIDSNEIKIVLKFIVEKDGSISNITAPQALSKPTESYDFLKEEAIRVLKTMPKWNPAEHEGVVVRSTFALPITIKINQ